MSEEPSLVPSNETGAKSDTENSITFSSANDAKEFFAIVKHRLLNINDWHLLTGTASASFILTDEKGNKVQRQAQLGDHFKIDIPGPGNKTGKGYDWVQIEAIEDTSSENEDEVSIRVRPSDSPQQSSDDVAHFFSEEATSTFTVERKNNIVIASVHGRNEKPNTHSESVIDKVRNAVVATGAILGLNKPQWKSLVKGLLKKD
jgi:hypothetical protein